ncbi:hypothetical protein M378DRAFT_187793 [Amanita muscaria Koide BX008]|uniref:Uncharacterized protein n=1 Tax=Amanita muscaria (strain Koide BX008) TaxID=946122 RepID=A0A0C2WFW9_AMAMK|nr:hypothetical protein M378DRAFT_187793 [Amanita muscaria Koide BX008]
MDIHFLNFILSGIILTVSFTDLAYNFTLSAWNTTLPNVNETGVPLVLGQNGASTGMSFQITSTYASYPYNDFPSMSINNGSLRAYLPSGFWMTNATAPRSGSPLGWVSSTLYSRPAETVFSVVHAPAGRLPMLAASGREDLWSLCPFQGFRGQTSIVYDVEKDDGIPPSSIGFDVRDCYAVEIYVIAAV